VLDARDLAPDGALAPAMARVWAAYDAAHDELTTSLREQLASHPEFGPLVAATPRDPAEEARSHATLRAALTTGQWAPYWERIRAQAEGYANAQISFSSPSWSTSPACRRSTSSPPASSSPPSRARA
jgi:hypothetical protein